MYSFIIPYRNRATHLKTMLPRLRQLIRDNPEVGTDAEIIVMEQDNQEPFWKSALYNCGAFHAKGDVLVFHDVDHFPYQQLDYGLQGIVGDFDASYPVRQVTYIDESFLEKPDDEIPIGYRDHKNTVGNHSGGVVIIKKDAFAKVKGFNPLYQSWGYESDDFRERMTLAGVKVKRPYTGMFLALPHEDNCPKPTDPNFELLKRNELIYSHWQELANFQYEMEISSEAFKMEEFKNETWHKIKSFNLKLDDAHTELMKKLELL
jgi:glycosyltransferase involved in cell wall biosynthesis